MLRRWGKRVEAGAAGEATAQLALPGETHPVHVQPAAEAPPGAPDEAEPAGPAPTRRTRFTKRRIALAVLALMAVSLAGAYSQKDRYSDQAADLSRRVLGDKNTSRIERIYFQVQDRTDRLKYGLFGGSTNPFAAEVAIVEFADRVPARTIFIDRSKPADLSAVAQLNVARPVPLALPQTRPLRDNLESGEGVWTTAGLPRTSPSDVLVAKTFVRPDKARPYALVGILLFDSRRIRLKMVGGTADPGGDRGVKGPGVIASDDTKHLLSAFTGGFKGPHGGFGMVSDGKEYRPLRNGLASIAITKDGGIRMGEWGRTITWQDDFIGVRQNAVLLVDSCEVSKRTTEGNDTWGYVVANSQEFITWRSAVGLTKDGNLVLAAGNSLSAESLARAIWAAGACTAMQLDINSPYVLTTTYFQQPDGSMRAEKFMDSMPDNPNRYFKTQERDFFYVIEDQARSLAFRQ